MTEAERKKQAAVLAMIANLPKSATIEDFNRLRFGANIIIPEDKKRVH
jgi:hypothetical protein